MPALSLTKAHGSRNDIFVVDGAPHDHYATADELTRAVSLLCDRRRGLGGDGVHFVADKGYRLQPMLLVVCQDRATAEWAARPVSFGPPQWPLLTLRPLVAGPHNMPVITDPAAVRKDLALATLSAITHGKNPDIGAILKAVTTVLQDTPDAVKNPIIEFVSQGLGKLPAAALWRKLVAVDLSFYKSPLFEEVRDEARAKGRAEDILFILERRGIDVPDEARARITACDDLGILRHWLDRALSAATAADIFTGE